MQQNKKEHFVLSKYLSKYIAAAMFTVCFYDYG